MPVRQETRVGMVGEQLLDQRGAAAASADDKDEHAPTTTPDGRLPSCTTRPTAFRPVASNAGWVCARPARAVSWGFDEVIRPPPGYQAGGPPGKRGDITASTRPPIFIVGCQRSGTTLLRLILDSHPNISCGPETLFLVDFVERVTGERHWRHLAQFGFPKEYWQERVAALVDTVQSDYARRRGKVRWADKTARYAVHLDQIDRLYPTCQVIHIIRDGRDVVASHRDRWGYLSALKAVRKWPWYVRTARMAGARLAGQGRYYEIRYEDLVTDPEPTLRKLLDFLGEPWDDEVLEHDRWPHDVQPRYVAFSSSRRAASGERHTIYRSRIGTGRQELGPLLYLLVRLVDGATLRDLGYA